MRNAKGEGSVSKTATGYRGYVTVEGKRKYFTAKTKAEAGQKKRELLNRKDKGTLVTGKDITLGDWMRHWVKVSKLEPSVRGTYDWNIEAYVVPHIGAIKLSALRAEHLENLYALMAAGEVGKSGKKLAPRTIRNVHANIRAALNVAVARGRVGHNVALHAVTPTVTKADTTSFSEADTLAILAAAVGDRLEARWNLGILYGVRPAEVLGLTWADIDMDNGVVHVHSQLQRVRGVGLMHKPVPKTPAGDRELTLAPEIVEMLKETRAQQIRDRIVNADIYTEWEYDDKPVGLVFTRPNGRPVEPRLDSRYWRDLLASTGLPHARRYQLRHTAATLMLDMGVDVVIVAATLGHANPSFTFDTYVHPLDVRKAEAGLMMGRLAKRSAPYAAPYEGLDGGSPGQVKLTEG
ncbi:site-specific integrase [Cryobacterium sp. Hh11]|uniref:tyrosine-type recombinase/integrase n=1 Tax=Cryobacterium sp. Hh11 TaxID=2555868 RepID=UPI00141AD248|nr:site-specific integrase [Cryobacterium sp. Hh11]